MSAPRKKRPTLDEGADWLRAVGTPPKRAGIDPLAWRGPDYKQLKAVGSINFGIPITDGDINDWIRHDRRRNTRRDKGVLIWQWEGNRQCLKLSFDTFEQLEFEAPYMSSIGSRIQTVEAMMTKTVNGITDPYLARIVGHVRRNLTRAMEDWADVVEATQELL